MQPDHEHNDIEDQDFCLPANGPLFALGCVVMLAAFVTFVLIAKFAGWLGTLAGEWMR